MKRLYLVLNVAAKPQVVGVVKQYPLYRQIFDDTKYRELNKVQMERLGFKYIPDGKYKLLELEIPIEKLY